MRVTTRPPTPAERAFFRITGRCVVCQKAKLPDNGPWSKRGIPMLSCSNCIRKGNIRVYAVDIGTVGRI